MKLSEEQQQTVATWAEEAGISLGEVQKRLKEILDINVTYLETRFLLEDHGIELKPEETPAEPESDSDGSDELDDIEAVLSGDDDGDDDDIDAGGILDPQQPDAPAGKVSVSVDEIANPSFAASGNVTFSDGKNAKWYIDQMGRLGLDPDDPGHRPSEDDVMAFQMELQRVVRGM